MAVVLIAGLLLAGCASSATGTTGAAATGATGAGGVSGISGSLTVYGGPIPPGHFRERGERIEVHRVGESDAVITRTDAKGRFQVDLEPGKYVVVSVPDDDKGSARANVSVTAGKRSAVKLSLMIR